MRTVTVLLMSGETPLKALLLLPSVVFRHAAVLGLCLAFLVVPGSAEESTRTNLIENGGLEDEVDPVTKLPAGWEITQTPADSYKVEVVDGGKSGKKCLRVIGEGKSIQIRLTEVPANPEKRTVFLGWVKGVEGDGVVSLMHRHRGPNKQRMGSTSIGGIKSNSNEWTHTSMFDHLEFNPNAIGSDAIINGGGKINALFDDFEAFTISIPRDDLLAAMGNFEEQYNGNYPGVYKRATASGKAFEAVPDDKNPANGKYCLRMKGNEDWCTFTMWPVAYDAAKVYALTGKVRANSGKAGLRIDYYKDAMRKDYLGSSTSETTDSKDWKTLTIDTSDNKKEASHIAVTCICHGNAEACFDELSLLAK